jgi:hypothetical protein
MPKHACAPAVAIALAIMAIATPVLSQPALSADSVQAVRTQLLAPAATRADLATLDRAYRLYHPGLTRYQSLARWSAQVDSLHQWFGAPRTRGDTYLSLSALVASMRDAHTYLNFWNQPKATRAWLSDGADKLPVTFTFGARNEWIVQRSAAFVPGDSAALQIQPGDTLVAINGTPTTELLARLLSRTRADGSNDAKRLALLGFRHNQARETSDVLLPLLAPPEHGRYALTIRRGGGRDRVIAVGAVSAAQRNAVARPLAAPRPPFSLTYDGDIAIITVDGFALPSADGGANAWATTLQRTFAELRQRGTRQLILDLQRNEGGSDDGAALLLSYLITTPAVVPSLRRYVTYDTVDSTLRPLLQTWDNGFYDRRRTVRRDTDGMFTLLDRGAWPDSIAPAALAFPHRIVILTSPVNSSASHLMLRVLPRRANITLVGTETGGSLWAHTGGNLFFLTLPNTGFETDIPLIAYQWDDRNPHRGVVPDIATSIDGAMPAALALLRRAAGAR